MIQPKGGKKKKEKPKIKSVRRRRRQEKVPPPDPFKHFRGASMGPGAYTINRDLLPKKPISKAENLGVGFNSRQKRITQYNFSNKVQLKKEKKLLFEILETRKNNDQKYQNFRSVNRRNRSKVDNNTFGNQTRFMDLEFLKNTSVIPGPGAYEHELLNKKKVDLASPFFRSKSRRILDSDMPTSKFPTKS